MFGRKLVFTARSTIVAGALVALCLPMSSATAQASTPSVSQARVSTVSSHVERTGAHDLGLFSGDAYDNEMGIANAGDDGPAHHRTEVDEAFWLPEIGDEVLWRATTSLTILMADMGGQ